jgi:hypothetical protein
MLLQVSKANLKVKNPDMTVVNWKRGIPGPGVSSVAASATGTGIVE